ncbi:MULTISPECIES: MAPEG family protein [unclassified Brevundimonas]|uniref:MAPEG family protein n=1 Tax=unclassified Brevundimonas TaxID=2622653 RepID=UPI0025C61639|nr:MULTISPECIES: MAPEG family protein [unclassified Brevundimonas]
MIPSTIQAAALWGGLLILLLFVLSGTAAGRRRRHRIAFGDGGQPDLAVASRAFGNAAEYIPAGLCGLILLALLGVPTPLIHTVGALLLTGRLIHALALLYQSGLTLARATGMTLTWLAMLITGVSLIAWSVL